MKVGVIHSSIIKHQIFAQAILLWLKELITRSASFRQIYCKLSLQKYPPSEQAVYKSSQPLFKMTTLSTETKTEGEKVKNTSVVVSEPMSVDEPASTAASLVEIMMLADTKLWKGKIIYKDNII